MLDFVQYSQDGAVALIELVRAPVNALNDQVAEELIEATRTASDPSVRAVVITGRPHFAAGADITGFAESFATGRSGLEGNRLPEAIRGLERLEKPVIAAVHGYALGGGLELAMGADFRYLAEDAQVGQPEIKLGLIPGAGGTQRLPRLVGFSKAKEINYTGRFVQADEALAIGLADEVFPPDELLGAAMQSAQRYAAGATLAIAAAKRAMNEGWGRPMDDALERERIAFDDCFDTADAREGVDAFLTKREPHFTGT
jgi:enoyl-CoA hydratase/carnithine racemase